MSEIAVGNIADIPPGEGRAFGIDGTQIAVFRLRDDSLRADFRSLDRVTTRGSAIRTEATFEVADRERGLHRVR